MTVQLGTLHFDLITGPSTSNSDWNSLSLDSLDHLCVTEESREPYDTLRNVMKDEGLGVKASYKISGRGLIVRVSILPSDSKESTWKRTAYKSRNRESHLKKLFWYLREGWEGEGDYVMARKAEDLQNMSELYAAIPSPEPPRFERLPGQTRSEVEVERSLMAYEEPEGIKTRLYDYQFRSVSKMLQMETRPARLVDPYFTPLSESGREGVYYVNTWNSDVQRHPGWYDLPRGGILCEQMGTGKTLVCLALIVATLSSPPRVPTDTIDISPPTNDHSTHSFPFPAYHAIRQANDLPQSREFPSLVDLCTGVLSRTDLSAKSYPYLPPDIGPILSQPLYYSIYSSEDPDDPCSRQAKRSIMPKQGVRGMYLAKGTLVIVPEILIEQWKFEVEKHVEQGVLRILEIGKEDVPPVKKLLEYDIILMDVTRFRYEETIHRAKKDLPPSELTKARWKRIILGMSSGSRVADIVSLMTDEGHIAGSTKTNAIRLATSLSVERRWIVSGTPSKHLQQGGETEVESINHVAGTANGDDPDVENISGAWSKRDMEDATRLGVMIGGFLAAQPFRSESNFQERVTNLLRGKDGPKFGAVRRLKYIMGATMVKHARMIINDEASLPPMAISYELLRFHPMQRITYNVLAALVASNVYTSAFEDPDYFLHPRNVAAFKQVIENLHLACFWFSGTEIDASGCLARTRDQLENNDKLTPGGRAALEEACTHLERALATPGWSEWMENGISIPYDGESLPPRIRDAWSDSMDTSPDMVDAHSLYLLRCLNTPGRTIHDLHLRGWESRAVRHAGIHEEWIKTAQKADREWVKATKEDATTSHSSNRTTSAAKRPTNSQTFSGKRKSTKKVKKDDLEKSLEEAARNAAMASARVVDTSEADLAPRPLPMQLATKSRSSKINFVLRSVMESLKDDKFVIFGHHFELGHVSEALDLVDIKSTYAGPVLSRQERAEHLLLFEKPKVKVLLLDVKLGARGLNLVVANRMIFLAPIWNLDVQAQAIKRVHRIGQTKPTKVEILVMQGTFEEDIARRSSSHRSEKEEQTYTRALIEKPSFVYVEDPGSFTFAIDLTPPPEPPIGALLPPLSPGSQGTNSPDETLVTPSTPNLSQYPPGQDSPIVRGSSPGATFTPGSAAPTKRPRVAFDVETVTETPQLKKKRAKVAFAD